MHWPRHITVSRTCSVRTTRMVENLGPSASKNATHRPFFRLQYTIDFNNWAVCLETAKSSRTYTTRELRALKWLQNQHQINRTFIDKSMEVTSSKRHHRSSIIGLRSMTSSVRLQTINHVSSNSWKSWCQILLVWSLVTKDHLTVCRQLLASRM